MIILQGIHELGLGMTVFWIIIMVIASAVLISGGVTDSRAPASRRSVSKEGISTRNTRSRQHCAQYFGNGPEVIFTKVDCGLVCSQCSRLL